MDELVALADDILERNEYVTVTYSVKARQAYSKGDFARVIEYKNKAMQTAPFATVECREYAEMLVVGIRLYEQEGYTKSAQLCKQELVRVADRIATIDHRLSPLGQKIYEQPGQYLSKDIKDYVAELKEEGIR